jgi:ABC-2 type transport system ATP-binding protein
MLHFDNFEKSYFSFTVLKIEDLAIKPGIFWIKGVNGSGKSTLLKSIAGILDFNGDIVLNGISIKKKPQAYRKLVNFAEAEPLFPEFLTGLEMIKLFSDAKGADENQYKYYIESMNMESYINNPLGTYSSGMVKKLSLVVAFLGHPKIILLDEPLITIDTDSLKILYSWITEKHQNENVSMFLSSHQPLEMAEGCCPQEIVIRDQTLFYNA